MGTAARTLIPQPVTDSTQPPPGLCLDDLLSGTRTLVDLKEVHELSRFVPVILLLPESCDHDKAIQPKLPRKSPRYESAQPAKILGILGNATERSRTPNLERTFVFGQVSVNFYEMSVCRNGQPVPLTMTEFKTLKYLIQNPRRVISRDELLNQVWGYQNYPCTRTVDNHIFKLRRKLEVDLSRPAHILTVHGAGYKFLP